MEILLIGAGGLGSAVALALLASPVKRLGLVDPDRVDLSNLHRQIIYDHDDLGALKSEAAARHLQQRRPDLEIETLSERLDDASAIAHFAQKRHFRVIVDGSDNFQTRFAANDAACRSGLPLVHGAATGWRGQLMSIQPGRSACLCCLFGGPPPTEGETCRSQGVLGPLVSEVGWLMAMEAARWASGGMGALCDRLLTVDFKTGRRRSVPLRRNSACPACGTRVEKP